MFPFKPSVYLIIKPQTSVYIVTWEVKRELDRRSSETLLSAEWKFLTDVSGQSEITHK